jgi:hypothetical protein
MSKIVFTLATLAALSSSAFAFQNRSVDLRDVEPFTSKTQVETNALAVDNASDASAPRIDYRQGTQDQVNN